jgi:RimJ/RimL family protein N-acetyltransferase
MGKQVFLRLLKPSDGTDRYASWLNDPVVNQYLECRFHRFQAVELKRYIRETNRDGRHFLFGIFLKSDGSHVGNIKIGDVDPYHRVANLGLVVGERSAWGRGIGTEAVVLATRYAFRELKLVSVYAGIYENNIGSLKAFLKAGWTEAGRLKRHRRCGNRWVAEIMVERLRS